MVRGSLSIDGNYYYLLFVHSQIYILCMCVCTYISIVLCKRPRLYEIIPVCAYYSNYIIYIYIPGDPF